MSTRTDLVTYLKNDNTRDKIYRAIQFGSKFVSNGEPGTARDVDQTFALARKVFSIFKVRLTFIFLSTI